MPAYEFFAATTTNLFIEHIKIKAEAYGWTIDFFGLYNGDNRLHIHNAYGSHFEIWYQSETVANIRGCTGYNSGAIPTAQPGVSGNLQCAPQLQHLIAVGLHSIFVKSFTPYGGHNWQFGSIVDKVGSWEGGTFISSTRWEVSSGYSWKLWANTYSPWQQVLINGAWSTLSTTAGGGVTGICENELYGKMPFAYSGGILPCPLLLVQLDQVTTTALHPIGYAPDVRYFNGGNVYLQLEEVTIGGDKWLALNQEEANGTFLNSPNILIRFAS